MAFHEDRFPTDISYGAIGGPKFKTTMVTLVSGREKRNIDWSTSRAEYDVSHGLKTQTQLNNLLSFFYSKEGKAHGFRYKDFLDFKIGDTSDDDSRQVIGYTDGATDEFQIYKRYTFGSVNFDRPIKKPVIGTTRIWVDGTERIEGSSGDEFLLDYTTGILTLGATLAAIDDSIPAPVEVITEFDIPVRFDTDSMPVSIDFFNKSGLVGSWERIPLVELRL